MPSLAHTRPGVVLGSIAGIGINRPPDDASLARRVSGADVAGVAYRVHAEQGVNTASLAAGAARTALQAADATPDEVAMIVVGTASPDVLWPSTACLVQTELKLPTVAAFDLYAAQAGFLTALDIALRYLKADSSSVLLIGADSNNQLVDLPGQGASVKGRGAAAALLRAATGDGGILATVIGGAGRAAVSDDGAGASLVEGLRQGVEQCLAKAKLTLADVDLVVGDQASPDATLRWSQRVGLDGSRLLLDPARYGTLLAAAPLAALHDAAAEGRVREGMNVLLVECGSGPVWAAACLRWSGAEINRW